MVLHFNTTKSQAAALEVCRTQKWQRWASETTTKTNQKKTNPLSKQRENLALLQWALEAATFQSSFHLLGVRAAIGTPENHLPPPALGNAATNTGGRCCLARPGTIHAGDLAGGRARSERLVALELLPHHLSLTSELWTWEKINTYGIRRTHRAFTLAIDIAIHSFPSLETRWDKTIVPCINETLVCLAQY